MKILKKVKKKPRITRDPKKESVYKDLASYLSEQGFAVRREKLRHGHGWRASSGSCEALGERLVFVDNRLSQDEQISFLLGRIRELGIELAPEQLEKLPPRIREQLIVPKEVAAVC